MTKVDQMVKTLLLEYPTLYKSRIDVLYSIFFISGAGYEWDDNGCIYNVFGTPQTTEMKYDDLDERLARLDEDAEKYKDVACLSGMDVIRRAELEIERKTREIIAANIDVFASEKTSDSHFEYNKLPSYVSQYGILATAPYGAIDSEWLSAFEEVMQVMRYSFNRIYRLQYDEPMRGEKAPEPSMFSRMPENLQKTFVHLKEIEDKLDAQSGLRARRAEMIGTVLGMLKEIKEESK